MREGSVATTGAALAALIQELAREEPILAGQEVGTMSYLVHDTLSAIGTKVLSFNAAQLRMIAASRKKTDRRDAFWIAKALASGMYPHPVYIPTGEIRELRALLTRRRMLQTERNRWQYRARAALRASGRTLRTGGHYLRRSLNGYLEVASDLEAPLRETLALCQRQETALALELRRVDTELRRKARAIDRRTHAHRSFAVREEERLRADADDGLCAIMEGDPNRPFHITRSWTSRGRRPAGLGIGK